jgi:hypothetical protein
LITSGGSLTNGGTALSHDSVTYGPLPGFRASAGFWLDRERDLAVEVGGFLLPKHTRTVALQSDPTGNPALGFRFLDVPVNGAPAEDVFQASTPTALANGPPQIGPYTGGVGFTSSSRLWGTEANLVADVGECTICKEDHSTLHVLLIGGFRYVDLAEDLELSFNRQTIPGSGSNVVFQGTAFPDPSAVSSLDSFRTRNQFYGGQFGARGGCCYGKWLFEFAGKIALGDSHEVQTVFGTSTLIPNTGPSVTVIGGQFAGPSNIGRTVRDEFAVMPEMELGVAYRFNANWRAYLGYNLLYWSQVVRPGRQVDLIVDTRGNPIDPGFTGDQVGVPRPMFNTSHFWAQGITFGVGVCY